MIKLEEFQIQTWQTQLSITNRNMQGISYINTKWLKKNESVKISNEKESLTLKKKPIKNNKNNES